MVDYLQGAAACAIVSGFDIWSSGSSKECWTHWGPSRQLHDLTSQFHLYWDKLGLIDMLNLLLFPESLLAFNWPTGSWNSCARIKRPCNSYNGWSDGKNYNKPLVTLIAERLQFHAISINILYSISTNFNRCTMLHLSWGRCLKQIHCGFYFCFVRSGGSALSSPWGRQERSNG